MHPFAYLFEAGFDFEIQNYDDIISYFEKGPYHYKEGLDYVGGARYESKECYWFMHKLSDIFGALRQNQFEIIDFDEYNLEMANTLKESIYHNFPLSYIITSKKNNS